jgi:hypothetical protein
MINNKMRKKEIMPFVVVYRDVFEDLDRIFDIVKSSEIKPISQFTGEKWEDWTNIATKLIVNADMPQEISNVPEEYKKDIEDQLYLRSVMFDKFYSCYDDYILNYSDCELLHSYNSIADLNQHAYKIFGESIKNWNFRDVIKDKSFDGWMLTTTDFVKYFDHYERDHILPYHIDTGAYKGEPGTLNILSATLYLNDDYEGGQISFVNEFFDTVVNYKPKAGDVLIFPGDRPFFHAALSTSGTNKYFARHFLTWNSTGSEEYRNNLEKFGEEQMALMQKHIRKTQEELGLFNKDVYLAGEEISNLSRNNGNIFIAKEIIDVDNKW